MEDALGVGGLEPVGHLRRQGEDLVDGKGLFSEALLQAPSLKILHGDEAPAIVLVDVVDGADVRVVQGRDIFDPPRYQSVDDEGLLLAPLGLF
jgi:hypothetical protein